MVRLCFDYGHGGKDSGAIYKGRKESIDNLDIGMEVAKRVRIFGVEVDEIRTIDVSIGLNERCVFANNGKYDYFISFHRNAFKPEVATGVETFVYTNASLKARPELESANFVITDPFEDLNKYKGNWSKEFNNTYPIYLELGCGTGKFIL